MTTRPVRVAAYIDGFNLYHAICAGNQPHLKWLNLRALCEAFAPTPQHRIVLLRYFSAFATWLPGPYRRHQVYASALRATGVECIMGRFKEKPTRCRRCKARWTAHEEKESDVALGAHLVADAFRDVFDTALVVTADNDVCPALVIVRRQFPDKKIRVLTPPGHTLTNELRGASGQGCKRIRWVHVERALFGAQVCDAAGTIVAIRPAEYDPPP